jgi:hypothetical protein
MGEQRVNRVGEAARESAAPIEMVDLGALISLLTDLGLGVTPHTGVVSNNEYPKIND